MGINIHTEVLKIIDVDDFQDYIKDIYGIKKQEYLDELVDFLILPEEHYRKFTTDELLYMSPEYQCNLTKLNEEEYSIVAAIKDEETRAGVILAKLMVEYNYNTLTLRR